MPFLKSVLYVLICGVASHFIGEALPRRWFHHDRIPFRPWKWEKDGEIYEKIRIQDIADELYVNANYLSEIFHQHEGVTITEFILQEKVGLTKNLLTYSPYTYSEIAAYLGFSSQSHLGKAFRRLTGLTLKQYRDLYGVREFRIKKAGL